MNGASDDLVLLSHGGGGARAAALIRDVILKRLGNPILDRLDDSACLALPGAAIAFTTDSYVVTPLVFPGGDIGTLAVCGTANDLAMQGARPLHLSLGLILEEGLPLAVLDRVLVSVRAACDGLGIAVVTGDTKVVERGRGGGLYLNTAGIGLRLPGVETHAGNARPGDAVLVTGSLGDHGVAVLLAREGLNLTGGVASDVAALWPLVEGLLAAAPGVRVLRDPTRGGLAAALCDVAAASGVAIRIRESALPVRAAVRAACDLLGLDPLQVANEGKALVVCPADQAGAALASLRRHPLGREAAVIGRIEDGPPGRVLLETAIGGVRAVEPPLGDDLPRIC